MSTKRKTKPAKKKVAAKTTKKAAGKTKSGVRETIVGVRVSSAFKRSLFAACKRKGTNPTDVLRAYMEAYVKK